MLYGITEAGLDETPGVTGRESKIDGLGLLVAGRRHQPRVVNFAPQRITTRGCAEAPSWNYLGERESSLLLLEKIGVS